MPAKHSWLCLFINVSPYRDTSKSILRHFPQYISVDSQKLHRVFLMDAGDNGERTELSIPWVSCNSEIPGAQAQVRLEGKGPSKWKEQSSWDGSSRLYLMLLESRDISSCLSRNDSSEQTHLVYRCSVEVDHLEDV